MNREILTQDDWNEIHSLTLFFDNIVKSNTGVESIDSAYHAYMENHRYLDSYISLYQKLAMNKPEVDSFLYELGTKTVFAKIFRESFGFSSPDMKDTVMREFVPNHYGGAGEILDKAIETDSVFVEYKEGLRNFATISPAIVAGFQNIHPGLDFEEEIIRTVVSMHYISIISKTSQELSESAHNTR
jgi:hypothetical protein